jgi:exodeoxyribonuclease VII large subunit
LTRTARRGDKSPVVEPSSTARAGEGPGAARVLTVTQLTRRIAALLEGVGRVSVEGEVSGLKRAQAGHVYFDLKDLDSKISCAIWRSQVEHALRFELADGMQVIVHGRLDLYAPRGSYSLIVQRVESSGLGTMLQRLEALKRELSEKGWFDRKRPLPPMPRVIGVATSRDGAALRDFLRTRSLRWPLYPVRIAHTAVQGPGAAAEIARAIRALDASGVDVVVVCRGGGSLEDLWAFNEREVAQAIRDCGVPVVSGVGHETDFTLADLVADARAHTPTDAAVRTIPDLAQLREALERASGHLARAIDGALDERAERLDRIARARVLRGARWILGDRAAALERARRSLALAAAGRCDALAARAAELERRLERSSPLRSLEVRLASLDLARVRLGAAARRALERAAERCAGAQRGLAQLSPLAVLARGYSITTRAGSRQPLVSSAGLRPDEELVTRFASGRATSRVVATQD